MLEKSDFVESSWLRWSAENPEEDVYKRQTLRFIISTYYSSYVCIFCVGNIFISCQLFVSAENLENHESDEKDDRCGKPCRRHLPEAVLRHHVSHMIRCRGCGHRTYQSLSLIHI